MTVEFSFLFAFPDMRESFSIDAYIHTYIHTYTHKHIYTQVTVQFSFLFALPDMRESFSDSWLMQNIGPDAANVVYEVMCMHTCM